ncbi:MAG: sn-glycerol-1-phosphate dehydrogenase [Halanaerobiales bacterium]|nr:sn-glycerol-1-phosphate dehydrogenase [Halanaerobiales bacterium]
MQEQFLPNGMCGCGKRHDTSIKRIILEDNALERVPEILALLTDQTKVYLIGDNNTFGAAGYRLTTILEVANYRVVPVIIQGERIKPTPDVIFEIMEQLEQDGYLIACGSGSINDLVKFLSDRIKRRYMVVATAPSMDGYASPVSALLVGGIKKTYRVAVPEVIIADLELLAAAPQYLIKAGVGDLLGKITSLLDWQLGFLLFDEFFCPRVFAVVEQQLKQLFLLAENYGEREQASIKNLIKGLIISGQAMEMVGNSRPASGCEHHLAHFLEQYSIEFNQPIPTHGLLVGLAVNYTAQLYLGLSQLDFSGLTISDNKEQRIKNIREIYGNAADDILTNLAERWEQEKLSKKRFLEREDALKTVINNFSQYLKGIGPFIARIGLIEEQGIRNISRYWLKDGLNYSFELRPRFTLCTLLSKLGLLETWVDQIL